MELFGLQIGVVPIVKIIGFAKECVIKEYIKNAKLVDTNSKFILENMPKGEALDKLAFEYLDTVEGGLMTIQLSLNVHNKELTEDKINKFMEEIMKQENVKMVETVVGEIIGKVDGKKNSV